MVLHQLSFLEIYLLTSISVPGTPLAGMSQENEPLPPELQELVGIFPEEELRARTRKADAAAKAARAAMESTAAGAAGAADDEAELPTVRDGRLYVRVRGRVVCFESPHPTPAMWKEAGEQVDAMNAAGLPLAASLKKSKVASDATVQSGGASGSGSSR